MTLNTKEHTNGLKSGSDDIATKRTQSQLPLDRGWAWFVMLGACVNTICLNTFVRAWSMLFLPFIDRYKSSATLTSLALGLNPAMFALISLLQPVVLIPRFKVRTMAVTGTLGHITSILLIAYAPNIIVLIIAFAINGLSMGLVAVPQTTILSHYFKRRLSLATSCATVGLSIATIAGPAFTQALLETYGLQGAVLMLAGLSLHGIPASMLFRPFPSHAETIIPEDVDDREVGRLFESNTNLSVWSVMTHDSKDFNKDRGGSHGVHGGHLTPTMSNKRVGHTGTHSPYLDRPRSRTRTTDSITEVEEGEELPSVADKGILELVDLPAGATIDDVTIEEVEPTSTLDPLLKENNPFTSKNSVVSNGKGSLVNSCDDSQRPEDINNSGNSNENQSCFQAVLSRAKSSLFANPIVAMLILSSAVGIHTNATFSYMAALGEEHGLKKSETPILLTVSGSCDLFSKILIGLFGDLRYVQPTTLVFGAQFVLGVSQQFVALYQGIPLMMLLQVLLGLTTGVYYVLLPVITVDLLGKEYIPHVMSGMFLINGAIAILDNMVTGIIKDTTGSFNGAYNYLGGLNLLGGSLILMTSFVVKCLRRRRERKE